MQDSILHQVLQGYLHATRAVSPEEFEEAVADIKVAGRTSVAGAIWASLALIQLDKPLILPLAVLACSTSLFLLVKRLVS